MIPLKDMHFKIQMCLSPEQEATMKSVLEARSQLHGGNPDALGFGYSQEIMSVPEAFTWFQALKLAYDQEQALSSGGDKLTGGRNS
jgi:hypothetical protein